jgi:threonine dehydratase
MLVQTVQASPLSPLDKIKSINTDDIHVTIYKGIDTMYKNTSITKKCKSRYMYKNISITIFVKYQNTLRLNSYKFS